MDGCQEKWLRMVVMEKITKMTKMGGDYNDDIMVNNGGERSAENHTTGGLS